MTWCHAPEAAGGESAPAADPIPRHVRRQWAELMRRGFGLDVLACPKCGGRLRLLGLVMERSTVRKMLAHAKMPLEPPPLVPAPADAEPEPLFDDVA